MTHHSGDSRTDPRRQKTVPNEKRADRSFISIVPFSAYGKRRPVVSALGTPTTLSARSGMTFPFASPLTHCRAGAAEWVR